MIEGIKSETPAFNLIDEETWNRGISRLYRETHHDGTFCYAFFRALALKRIADVYGVGGFCTPFFPR